MKPLFVPTPVNCPVIQQAETVMQNATQLRASVRKLRQALQACNDCPNSGDCAPLQEVNRQIDAAITALTTEWGLNEPLP